MRLGRLGMCLAIALSYIAVRMVPVAGRLGYVHYRHIFHLSILLTAVIMLVQLALAVSVVRLKMKPLTAFLVAALSAAIVFVPMMLPLKVKSIALGLTLLLSHDLFLMVFAASIGYLVSFIVREPNILLPAAVFAGLVDFWGVTWGPLSVMLSKAPQVVDKASVHMPNVMVRGVPTAATIGMGDFLFLALFFGVLYRFNLNTRGAFWLGYALLTVSMFIVIFSKGLAIPALVPMGIAILVTNVKHFKLKREELLATLYVGGFLFVLLIFSALFMHKK